VDCEFGAISAENGDDLEQIAIASRPKVKPAVLVSVFDRHRVSRCMLDVLISDPVLPG
jgi:hypothetical protein